MSTPLRKLFNAKKLGAKHRELVKVLVSLKANPNDGCVRELQNVGLRIKEVNANIVIGEIPSDHLQRLEQLDAVMEVERSVRTSPTKASTETNEM